MTGDAFDCTLFAAAQLSAKLPRSPRSWQRGIIGFAPEIEFAANSLLEGDGFEPSVPPVTGKQFRRGPFAHPETAAKIGGLLC